MGLILFAISIILFVVLMPLNAISTFIVIIIEATKGNFFYSIYWHLDRLFLSGAISIDTLGNVLFQHLFNVTLRKEDGYKFGKIGETVSSVLGKNQRDNTLTKAGKLLCFILDFLDENHCEKSIVN